MNHCWLIANPTKHLFAEEAERLITQEHVVALFGCWTSPSRIIKLVNVELQDDFSMDQALSLYLLETIPLMDPQAPDYALVLLTLVESILEDPDIILRKQLDKVKDQKMAEMKMEGIEYDQRMEELEKLEYPKPNREFVYSTFNAFAARHPWVGQENIRPKSIAREMFEEFRSFADYIKLYELQRAEGVLLRHLNSVYKVLAQTVPDAAKNDQVREMELYLGTMIRQVDSSLLDEWEKMRDPNYQRGRDQGSAPARRRGSRRDITRDTKAFTAAIRNRIFTFLRGLVIGDYEQAIANLNSPPDADGQPWTADALAAGAGRLPRRTRAHLPRPERPQCAPHLRRCPPKTRKPGACNKCWWTGGAQRLGGGIRGGPGESGSWANRGYACASLAVWLDEAGGGYRMLNFSVTANPRVVFRRTKFPSRGKGDSSRCANEWLARRRTAFSFFLHVYAL